MIGKGGETLKAVGTAVRAELPGRLPRAVRAGGEALAAPRGRARPPRVLRPSPGRGPSCHSRDVTRDAPHARDRHTDHTRDAYDRLAPVWSAATDDGPFNGHLERPALRSLIPTDLQGATVLEAACGAGAQAEWLLAQGCDVVGFDLERGDGGRDHTALWWPGPLLRGGPGRAVGARGGLARRRHVLACPPLPRGLDRPAAVVRRALRPGGWAVVSLDHPCGPPLEAQQGGYFDVELVSETWRKGGVEVTQHFWRRPLAACVAAFADAGCRDRAHRRAGSPPPRRCADSRPNSSPWSACPGSSCTGCVWRRGGARATASAGRRDPGAQSARRRGSSGQAVSLPRARQERHHLVAVDACASSAGPSSRAPPVAAVARRLSSTATTPRSSDERIRRPAPWASRVPARGRSTALNAPGPARSRRAWSTGSSGRGNGMRSW